MGARSARFHRYRWRLESLLVVSFPISAVLAAAILYATLAGLGGDSDERGFGFLIAVLAGLTLGAAVLLWRAQRRGRPDALQEFLGQGGGPAACFLHNPRYDFNDEVIPLGAGYLAALVEEALPLN